MNWKSLKAANGPATKIPKTIPKLSSADRGEAEQAFMDLRAALIVVGKWFPASAPSLTLLADQIGTGAPGAYRALLLIGEIVGGEHTFALSSAPSKKAPHRQEVLEACVAIVPKLLRALDDSHAATRVAAGFALACFASALDAQSLGEAALAARAAVDPDSAVRASAGIALGALARAGHEHARTLVATPQGDGFALGGATVGALIAGVELPAQALTRGVAAYAFGASAQDLVPWGGWNEPPVRLLRAVLAARAEAKRTAVAIGEAAGLGPPGSQASAELVDLALELGGFYEGFGEDEIAEAKRLDEQQRAVAEALARSGAVLRAGHGLPGAAACVRRWLGAEEPTALERPRPSKGPLWLECRALLGKRGASKTIRALLLDGLAPVDKLRVKTALLFGDYRLLKDAALDYPPDELARDATEAGALAVPWAHEALSRHLASPEVRLGATAYAPRHSMVALFALIAAGEAIRAEWLSLIPIVASARGILEKAPADARQAAALAKIDGSDLESCLRRLLPVLDLVGSRELADKVDEMRARSRLSLPPEIESALLKLRSAS
jgi:hypothetical protein